MKGWFTSRSGAITLSVLALLAFLGRTFVDYQYVFPEFFPSPGQVAIGILVYTALIGAWFWALLAAALGRQRAFVAVFIFVLFLPVGLGIGTLVSFCPSPCDTAWPLGEIANWIDLLLGLLAAAAVGLQLRRGERNA